jgi:hypothetical protein
MRVPYLGSSVGETLDDTAAAVGGKKRERRGGDGSQDLAYPMSDLGGAGEE